MRERKKWPPRRSLIMASLEQVLKNTKPYLAAILLQFLYAGMSIISKFALNQGMSQHVLAVYRHAIATAVIAPFGFIFDRNPRPQMTLSVFAKVMLIALFEPVIDQNLYYTGMKYTTAAFASALSNVTPALAFLLAWIVKLERVNIRRFESQAKILGTVITIGGAMMITLLKGSMLHLPWIKKGSNQNLSSASDNHDLIKGALLIIMGCVCWSGFVILHAITLISYPAELSLTAWICLMGAVEGTVLALILERHNPAAWSIHLDSKLLAYVYSGVMCSGVAYYVQGIILKDKGPVFVSAFGPLSMVIVAIMASFVLGEAIYIGRVIGALVIVIGLYLVLWGKSKDQDSPQTSPRSINCSQMNSSNLTRVESVDESI